MERKSSISKPKDVTGKLAPGVNNLHRETTAEEMVVENMMKATNQDYESDASGSPRR